MTITLSRKMRENRIDMLSRIPLKPLDFVLKWVKTPRDERGWRKEAIALLARTTGKSPGTIKNWGAEFQNYPDDVPVVLRQSDLLLQARSLLNECDFLQE